MGRVRIVVSVVSVEDGGATLRIVGNGWKKVAFPYVVTADTVLEFDFSSSVEGEIQGIGFDTDDVISRGSDVPVVWDPSELRDSATILCDRG